MPHLENCVGILRRVIAKGDINGVPLAERAVNEYLLATPVHARKSGLRLLLEDVLVQRNAVLGNHRAIAETISYYIGKKLAESKPASHTRHLNEHKRTDRRDG